VPKKPRKQNYDVDYWEKLSPEERKWLAQVLREENGFSPGKGRERILTPDQTRQAWREAKRRRRDIIANRCRIPLDDVEHELEAGRRYGEEE
jgi:hypothetical protein